MLLEAKFVDTRSFKTLEAIFGNNPYLFNYLVLDVQPSWHSIISMYTVIS